MDTYVCTTILYSSTNTRVGVGTRQPSLLMVKTCDHGDYCSVTMYSSSVYTHTHARTHTGTHTCTHAHTHTRTHAHTHTCTHTRTHARTHTHIHTPMLYSTVLPTSVLPQRPQLLCQLTSASRHSEHEPAQRTTKLNTVPISSTGPPHSHSTPKYSCYHDASQELYAAYTKCSASTRVGQHPPLLACAR